MGCAYHRSDGSTRPPELIGIHTNMAGAVPSNVSKAIQTGGPMPPDLSAEERHAFEQLKFFFTKGVAYALEMGNRPQTLYGIADSPVGLAAWILDHDALSLELMSGVFEGHPTGPNRRCARNKPYPRRYTRQHHALLGDEYGDFFGSSLLGKQVALFRRKKRIDSSCRECLPIRYLYSPTKLGRAGISQTHPL